MLRMPVPWRQADHRERYRMVLVQIMMRSGRVRDDDNDSIETTESDEIRNMAMSRIPAALESSRESLHTAAASADAVEQRPGTTLFDFLSSPNGRPITRLALAYHDARWRSFCRRNFPSIQRWAVRAFLQMEYEDQLRLDLRNEALMADEEQRINDIEREELVEKIIDTIASRYRWTTMIDATADVFEQHKENIGHAHDAYTKSLLGATDRERDSVVEALYRTVWRALKPLLRYYVSTLRLPYR